MSGEISPATASCAAVVRSAVTDGEAGDISLLIAPPRDRISLDGKKAGQTARQQLLLLLEPRRSRRIFPRQPASEVRDAPK